MKSTGWKNADCIVSREGNGMKIEISEIFYNVVMILLVMAAALVVTKSIGKWIRKNGGEE